MSQYFPERKEITYIKYNTKELFQEIWQVSQKTKTLTPFMKEGKKCEKNSNKKL